MDYGATLTRNVLLELDYIRNRTRLLERTNYSFGPTHSFLKLNVAEVSLKIGDPVSHLSSGHGFKQQRMLV